MPNSCALCGAPLSQRNRTGYCPRRCYDAARRSSSAPCLGCGGPLGQSNQSGYCRRCTMRNAQRARNQRGAANPGWKGGKHVDERGYIRVRIDGKHRREHRVIAEQVLGRSLTAREVVHHKDGNTGNNDPANLEVYCCNAHHLWHNWQGDHPIQVSPLS
ncbi:MAG TPA: HNH endonuclease [Chloroflexia bacterium]